MVCRYIIRRVGGIKRLFIMTFAALVALYFVQTFMLNSKSGSVSASLSTALPVGQATASNADSLDNATSSILVPSNPNIKSGENFSAYGDGNIFVDCGVNVNCKKGTLPFALRALRHSDGNGSQFCISGNRTFEAPTLPKTISVVVMEESKLSIDNVNHFDVSIDDKEFRDFLLRLPYYRMVFISSAGDLTNKLKLETTMLLANHFGAPNESIGAVIGGIVFIGQKGLKLGQGMARVDQYGNVDAITMHGCLNLPLGQLDASTPLPQSVTSGPQLSRVIRRGSISPGQDEPNCGLSEPCPTDQVSVSVYSGKNKDDEPRICINGRIILSRSLNSGGRGLNVVVLNGTSKEITSIGHFDTYEEDSTLLETYLDELIEGDIVVAVSFDEASKYLSGSAKNMLYELGSALIQDIKFRASWYFVGQKGIAGFTSFEELNYPVGNDWAKPIVKRLCIPRIVDGLRHLSAKHRNEAKRRFCDKYDGYEEFCEIEHLDDPIMPKHVDDRSLVNHAIFNVPILVVAGLSDNSLRLCLESLIALPGLKPHLVLVTFDENYAEGEELAKLFRFRVKPVAASASYTVQLAKSFDELWSEFPNAKMAIVIEEELTVTLDFLSYMSQMLPIMENDRTLVAASAWNVNGFATASSVPELAYRAEDFPGFAFMIRKSTYVNYMKGKMDECCFKRAWEGWRLPDHSNGYHTIIPDTSRVARRHVDVIDVFDQNVEDFFHRRRSFMKSMVKISNVEALSSEISYDESLRITIASAIQLNTATVLQTCSSSNYSSDIWSMLLPTSSNRSSDSAFVIYFAEKRDSEKSAPRTLMRFRRCFGLYYKSTAARRKSVGKRDDSWARRGFYKGLLRFTVNGGRSIFLIGSNSPFYQHKGTES